MCNVCYVFSVCEVSVRWMRGRRCVCVFDTCCVSGISCVYALSVFGLCCVYAWYVLCICVVRSMCVVDALICGCLR